MKLSERSQTISALGVVQIFTWGTTYYLLAILADPIDMDTGWGAKIITGGISIGLLVSGLAARLIGGLIQEHGGRLILSAGIVLVAIGLGLMGSAQSVSVYLASWVVIGLGMGASLYDAAFSALGRIYGTDARAAITALTLWGGFASTICWPISAWLVESYGWRAACFAYMFFHFCVTLPLCWLALPKRPPVLPTSGKGSAGADTSDILCDIRFWCIAIAGTVLAMLVSIWSIHLITILTAEGYTLAAAVALGTLIGPAQVAARFVEMIGKGRHHPVWTMIVSSLLILLGFAGLLLEVPASAALIAYGAGNGLWYIARGTLPLAIFGPEEYPRIIGSIATPVLIAAAAAPLLGVELIARFGAQTTLVILAIASLVPCLSAMTLWFHLRKR